MLPDTSLTPGDIHVRDGRLVEESASTAERIDCRGLYLLPGIVDVHGDAFERELEPRPGVDIDHRIALTAVDRILLTNGITTAFHGLTVSWEPGARSLETGQKFMRELQSLRPHFLVDHRVQVRWETFALHAVETVITWLRQTPQPALAFNDHTTSTIEKLKAGEHRKLDQWAARACLTPDQYIALALEVAERSSDVPAAISAVATAARDANAVMLSHDDRRLDERHRYRALGANVCEFPLAVDVAKDARESGETVVLGGPNVIRGGSHTGALTAEDAVRDKLCDVLASDYYYPSLLHAAERLVVRGVCSLAEAWALISQNPARAMGLGDRGTLAPGQRADMVLLKCNERSGNWQLISTIVDGHFVQFCRP